MERLYMRQEEACRLKGYIMAAGYNIGKLAEELGMSRATLSSRINGRTDFARAEMEKISEKLKRQAADIFFAA